MNAQSSTHSDSDCRAKLHASGKFISPLNPYLEVEIEAMREILRQARQSFNLQTIAIASSIGIGVFGGVLMLANKTPEGLMAVTAGLLSSGTCTQIKTSQDRLALLVEKLENLHSDDDGRQ